MMMMLFDTFQYIDVCDACCVCYDLYSNKNFDFAIVVVFYIVVDIVVDVVVDIVVDIANES